jgi:ATP adenylyltransferase
MDRLWAPWRMAYIKNPGKSDENFITRCDKETKDRENLVVLRTDLSIVLLNRYPYNNGHLLVAPRREVADFGHMTDAELLDCQRVLRDMIGALTKLLKCEGCNVGLNLGKAAGAGLPQHLHWHIVPRWNGDTNFMTTVGDARVIIESLDEMWLQLRRALNLPVA